MVTLRLGSGVRRFQRVLGGTKPLTLFPGLTDDQYTVCAGAHCLYNPEVVCSLGLHPGGRRFPAQRLGLGPELQGASRGTEVYVRTVLLCTCLKDQGLSLRPEQRHWEREPGGLRLFFLLYSVVMVEPPTRLTICLAFYFPP